MDEVRAASFPRRDGAGRITHLGDLLGTTLAGLVVGLLALVLLDGVFTLIGAGEFGRTSGWLVVILPAWLFVEEFRAWGTAPPDRSRPGRDRPGPGPARFAAAPVAAAVGITAGLLVAGSAAALAPLWTGALAGTVFACSYALIWFLGVRWLERRTG